MGIYISWVKGLPQDKQALSVLKRSGVIAGIEMSNIDDNVERILDQDLGVSCHTPGGNLTLNLASPRTLGAFLGPQAERLLKVISLSSSPFVSFHLGYSASEVVKMRGFPNIPFPGTIISDPDRLLELLTEAITRIAYYIGFDKRVLVETLDYNRQSHDVPWDKQSDEVRAHRAVLQGMVNAYGINAALLHVTDAAFVGRVLRKTASVEAGFLFDIAHNFISADAKICEGIYGGNVDDYFEQMLAVVAGRTKQLHVNVPSGDSQIGYQDNHRPFDDSRLSDRILDLTAEVWHRTRAPVITLEIDSGLPPLEHVKLMIAQAERLAGKIASK